MIISKSPVRVSLLGGGSDHPNFIKANGYGMCVGGAINQYSYLTCRYLPQFFHYKTYLSYSEIEKVQDNSEIKHRIINAIFKFFNLSEGIELTHLADLPSQTGTGSSSTFLVGLINVCSTLKGNILTPDQLAKTAIYIEQSVLKESVGYQDSCFAALGGFQILTFDNDRIFKAESLLFTESEKIALESHLMLFYSGIQRSAHHVTSSYVEHLTGKKMDDQKRILELAHKGVDLIRSRNFDRLGPLLTASWSIKRELSHLVSTDAIDRMYNKAMQAGALGAKLGGAGGGGCLICVVKPHERDNMRRALSDYLEIPLSFSQTGSKIIVYDR